ncbi:MAG TPA: hypothetical protein VN844_15690 [Pyrinomonadaceae bacterium]|nr:hypothetical protein [Pyrinomonadaceae bacterium]
MIAKLQMLALLCVACFQSGVNVLVVNLPPNTPDPTPVHNLQTAASVSPLRLTTTIIDSRYCKKPEEQNPTLFLTLQARFLNVSEHPVILYRGDNLVAEAMISRSVEDAANKNYESSREFHSMTSGSPPVRKITSARPSRKFVVLQPDRSIQTQVTVPITILPRNANAGSNEIDPFGAIPYGNHVLQVTLTTWLGTRQEGEELRQRWSSTGTFWFGGVTSEPMPFDVQPKRSSCP